MKISDKKKRYDIVAIGESLVDFVPSSQPQENELGFSGFAGGAPGGVLACASKLGLRTAFISKVGYDCFGTLFRKTLSDLGVDVSAVKETSEYPTSLMFDTVAEGGDHLFNIYQTQTADTMMTTDDIDTDVVRNARFFHFGTISMRSEPSRATTLEAVRMARDGGSIISYDPNYRPYLWSSEYMANSVMLEGLALADIVKLSREELFILSQKDTIEEGMDDLFQGYPMKLLVVTLDKEGSICIHQNGRTKKHSTFVVDVVDSTGVGDAFWGAFLYEIITQDVDLTRPDEVQIAQAMRFANASGTLSATKHGGTASLPTLSEIEQCIEREHLTV